MHVKREYLDVRASEWLIWALVSNAISKLYPAFIFQLICCFHLNASKIALQPNFLTF